MDPNVSIVISFLGFVWIFKKKAYPLLVQKLDDYIQSVRSKIDEAELTKDESSLALRMAHTNKSGTADIIEKSKEASHAKIKRIRDENDEYLKSLTERFENSLEVQLEAELAKQKDLLIEKIADQVVKNLSEKLSSTDCEPAINFTKEDLQKLAGNKYFS
ncbi:MAG: hypothetical protein LBB21_06270 [Holosporaceae bacterium]|jgi:F0F1-type ATP synthase membrane subunit b/b'|nr:hypothetical protein [Holosporaceae bacterium]